MIRRRYNISYKKVFAWRMFIILKIRLLQRVSDSNDRVDISYPLLKLLIFRSWKY